MDVEEILKRPPEFRYMLFSRLWLNAQGYIEHGGKLWADNAQEQGEILLRLFESLAPRPRWIELNKFQSLLYKLCGLRYLNY